MSLVYVQLTFSVTPDICPSPKTETADTHNAECGNSGERQREPQVVGTAGDRQPAVAGR